MLMGFSIENGLLTQSRLILLDSPLIAFTALTALAWTCFTNQHEQGPSKAFDPSWWFWLVASGLGLGATVSVKWVGLFTIAWVGSLTIVQLWVLLGDNKHVTTVRSIRTMYLSREKLLTIVLSVCGSSTFSPASSVSLSFPLLSIRPCLVSTFSALSTRVTVMASCHRSSRPL